MIFFHIYAAPKKPALSKTIFVFHIIYHYYSYCYIINLYSSFSGNKRKIVFFYKKKTP